MADTATFTLALDNRISGPAGEARSALSSLREEMRADRRQLSSLQAEMRRGSSSLSRLRGAGRAGANSLAAVGNAGNAGAAGIGGMGRSMLSTLGNLGAMAGGAIAVAGAVKDVVVAVVQASIALGKFALASAEAARAEELRLEVFARTQGRSRDAAGDARGMSEAIDRVSDRTGVAREELEGYARAAHRAGLRGTALEAAVRGAATKGAALGERWGRSFIYTAAAAGRAGRDIGKLADETEQRYGQLAERQMSSTANLWRRFTMAIDSWFRDVDIEPLLQSLSRFVRLFSRASQVGQAWSEMLTSVGIDGALSLSGFVDKMSEMVERTTLGTLKMQNDWLDFQIGLTSKMADLVEFFRDVQESISSIFDGLPTWLQDGFSDLTTNLGGVTDLDRRMRQQGLDVALGLAKGIMEGASPVTRAAAEVMGEAERAARERAQIRSPSKLFASLGRQLGAGVEVGIERSVPSVGRAAAELVEPPPLLAPPRLSADIRGSSTEAADRSRVAPRVSVVVGDIVIQGAGGGESMLDDLRARVEEIFSDAVRAAGAV